MPPAEAMIESPATERVSYKRGDLVLHPKKREWGRGVVINAAALTHDGKPAQRLTIDFANKGKTVINTGVVKLQRDPSQPPDEKRLSPRNTPQALNEPQRVEDARAVGEDARRDDNWLDELEKQNGKRADMPLAKLPDVLTDAFSTLPQRLTATLDTFKWSTEPHALMDWAVTQTGMDDPMSAYTRHELEDAFRRFVRDRDTHLRDLVRQMKRNNLHEHLQNTIQQTQNKDARNALKRAMKA